MFTDYIENKSKNSKDEKHEISIYQQKWESRSSIRSRPRKPIDFNLNGYFFPEEKQPLLLSQKIFSITEDTKQKILIQTFKKYLNDIISLESESIIRCCKNIINKNLAVEYSEEHKIEALTIIIDEYYHIYVAKDMLNQINSYYKQLKNYEFSNSEAKNSILEIKNKLHARYHDIFEILAVCIFETTLVKELVEFFSSKSVHPSIKHYVNDHMNDEARHYSYFFNLLSYTWNNINEEYKTSIGCLIPQFIKLYLNVQSDKNFNYQIAQDLVNDSSIANEIVESLYYGFEISPDIPIVKNVLYVLKQSGILSHQCVQNEFKNLNWNL